MELRQSLLNNSPSIELQHAALAEIIRLDAVIAKLLDYPIMRHIDGNTYKIPMSMVDQFDSDMAYLESTSEDDSDWDMIEHKYNQYKV